MAEPILMQVAGGVATITFNRPEKRNAVTQAMWRDFTTKVEAAERDPDVGLVQITGTGGSFASGADLQEYGSIHVSREAMIAYLDTTAGAFAALADCSKPTIASIDGPCMGGGCMIAIACDLRIASTTARFALPPSKLGLAFPLSNVKRIVDVIGAPAAKDMLFSARTVEAEEALQMRLVNAVHPAEELAAATDARIRGILVNSPWSVTQAKALIARVLAGESRDTAETRQSLLAALESEDYREGRAAFVERRKPRYRFAREDGA